MLDLSLELKTLYNVKKVTLPTIFTLIEHFTKQESSLSLPQKYAIIVTLTKSLAKATQAWLSDLEKFRYGICFAPFLPTTTKKTKRLASNRKTKAKTRDQKPDKSFEQMLRQANVDNQTNIQLIVHQTPRKEAIFEDNKFSVTVPPFDPQTILKLSQDVEANIKSQSKEKIGDQFWQPKLSNYQRWLALTQQGIDLTTEKKRTTARTKKKIEPKRKADDKIDVVQQENRLQEIQILTTKVKLTREFKRIDACNSLEQQLKLVNPYLLNTPTLLKTMKEKLQKFSKADSSNQKQKVRNISNLNYSMLEIDPIDQIPRKFDQQSGLFIPQNNDPSMTAKLQNKIAVLIDNELFAKPQVSFNFICEKKSITSTLKGELFYQMLHLNYQMVQNDPAQFGDILIGVN